MILVGSELLCQFPVLLDEQRLYGSVAFFCPECGEVWARLVIGGQRFYPAYACCKRHGPLPAYRGTLLHQACSDYVPFFPAEVWNRELQLLAGVDELW